MRLLFRILSIVCLLIAMVAVVIDAIKNLAAGTDWVFTSLRDQWSTLSPYSLAFAEKAVESHAGPFIWNPIITELLRAPTWEAFGIVGFVLFWLGRDRAPAEIEIN